MTDRGASGARFATQLVRASVRLCPRRYRDAFGAEVVEVFAERFADERAQGLMAAAKLVARTELDLVATAALEHLDAWHARARGSMATRHRPAAPDRGGDRMDRVLQDLKFAGRALRASPGHTTAAALTMALGIGANVAIFSLVDALLLRPAPGVEDPEHVVALFTAEGGAPSVSSYVDFRDLEHSLTTLRGLAAFKPMAMDLSASDTTERIEGMLVTARYFEGLGVEPVLGRFFLADEDRPPDQTPVVVLGWGLWQRRFGGSEEVIGREVRLNGRMFTVIGVAPAGFRGTLLSSRPEAFAPMAMQPHFMPTAGYLLDRRGWGGVLVVGRLSEGLTIEQARAELATRAAQLRAEHREAADREYRLSPLRQSSLLPEVRSQVIGLSTLLLAVVSLVLLVACSNVANLLLARAASRERELAVRGALGAGRARLVGLLLTESLLLALLGGSAGLAVAFGALRPLRRLPLPFELELGLDARVLAFAAAVTLGSCLLFGLLPALRATRRAPAPNLRGAGASAARPRVAAALVVTQVAVSILLVVLAGLFGQTLLRLGSADLGFRHEDVALATIDPSLQGYQGPATAELYSQLAQRAAALPGAVASGLASNLPGSGDTDSWGVFPAGAATAERRMSLEIVFVDPGYFGTLGLELREGRFIEPRDGGGAQPVAVLNETAATLVAAELERPALGAVLWTGGDDEPPFEVVGVIADSTTGALREPPAPLLHLPMQQVATAGLVSRMTLLVRSAGEPSAQLPAIRALIRELDPHVPVIATGTLESQLAGSLVRERLSAGVLATSALLAVLLAAVGLYGVLGTALSRRTAELGVRMALGARAVDLVRMVVAEGLWLCGLGLLLGLAGAMLSSRLIGSWLYGVSALDPVTYLAAAAFLALVAAVASYLPARRATRVDPVTALRAD